MEWSRGAGVLLRSEFAGISSRHDRCQRTAKPLAWLLPRFIERSFGIFNTEDAELDWEVLSTQLRKVGESLEYQ